MYPKVLNESLISIKPLADFDLSWLHRSLEITIVTMLYSYTFSQNMKKLTNLKKSMRKIKDVALYNLGYLFFYISMKF